MTAKTVAIIGSLNLDLITRTSRLPTPGETLHGISFSTGSGGKGANQAVACARLSRSKSYTSESAINVRMIGAVGSDSFGRDLISGLQRNAIDVSGVKIVEGWKTGVAVIVVEEASGENRIILNPGANFSITPDQFGSLPTPLPSLVVLQLEIPLETVVQILRVAKKLKIPTLLNLAPANILPNDVYHGLSHLILNETEAEYLAGQHGQTVSVSQELPRTCDLFHHLGVTNVIITLGKDGVFYSNGDTKDRLPASPVSRVIDTTAAGDTFVGAYAVCVADDRPVSEAVGLANVAAAAAVEKEGAQDAIPWLEEVLPRKS